ncbi:MAG: hypothetical protein AB1758_02925 [Candidatus Eremiobacterota bacterium]
MESDRELLLNAAGRLFHRYGTRVPLSEVLAAAEVSESQFYQLYPTRDDLVAEVAERQMDRILAHLEPYVNRMERWEDLAQWRQGILGLAEIAGLLGCPVGVIAMNATPETQRTLNSVQRALNRWAKLHVRALSRLKERGVFVQSFEPRKAVQFAGAIVQGALLLGRAYQDPSMLERNFDAFLAYLETFRATTTSRA